MEQGEKFVTKLVRCKECKYYEHDSWGTIDGVDIIIAHDICNKWGGGCKTSEHGFCHLGEKKEKSGNEG